MEGPLVTVQSSAGSCGGLEKPGVVLAVKEAQRRARSTEALNGWERCKRRKKSSGWL